MYGELLAREYQDLRYMRLHDLTVDAYALQHPGKRSDQTISSANIHLGSLYAYFEMRVPATRLGAVKKHMAQQKARFAWLNPPTNMTQLTVKDVLAAQGPEQHAEQVEAWASYVFQSWSTHHATTANYLNAAIAKSVHITEHR